MSLDDDAMEREQQARWKQAEARGMTWEQFMLEEAGIDTEEQYHND